MRTPSGLLLVAMRLETIMKLKMTALALSFLSAPAFAVCPYDNNCLDNTYGGGNPYKSDGLMNPFSGYGNYGSRQNNTPYATPPGAASSTNAYSRYANPYSPDSPSNPYGAGNPYDGNKVYVPPPIPLTR